MRLVPELKWYLFVERIEDEALATVETALSTVMSAESPSADELDHDVYATPIKFPV